MSILLNSLKVGSTLLRNSRPFHVANTLKIIFHDESKKRFLFNIEYGSNAEIHYRQKGDVVNVIDLHHTYVPQKYRGKGIAYLMAEEVFEYITVNNMKVVLSCPFLIDYYKDHPELETLMYQAPKKEADDLKKELDDLKKEVNVPKKEVDDLKKEVNVPKKEVDGPKINH